MGLFDAERCGDVGDIGGECHHQVGSEFGQRPVWSSFASGDTVSNRLIKWAAMCQNAIDVMVY